MGAVVHADHGNGERSVSVSGIKQGDYLAQVAFGGFGTFFEVSGYCGEEFSFGIGGSIAFFSDGKAGHLERRIFKNLPETRVFCFVFTVQDQRLHDAAYDGLFHGVVGL